MVVDHDAGPRAYGGLLLAVAGAEMAVSAYRKRKLDFEPTGDPTAPVIGDEARGFKGRDLFEQSPLNESGDASDD
jgi:hypothetical protein